MIPIDKECKFVDCPGHPTACPLPEFKAALFQASDTVKRINMELKPLIPIRQVGDYPIANEYIIKDKPQFYTNQKDSKSKKSKRRKKNKAARKARKQR